MERTVQVKPHSYHDSVTLMALSAELSRLPGVMLVQVAMGTDHNKELLEGVGLLTDEARQAGPNDLVIAVAADGSANCAAAMARAEEILQRRVSHGPAADNPAPRTIAAALRHHPEANLALISVPGQYAAREARLALEQGLHVMLFSDNVSIEEEVALKQLGKERGLLVMGPDCGTAIIDGVALGFANAVRRGRVGIVGASGTGIQEATVLLDRMGMGISHAIGTGGRDLSHAVGGLMMIEGIRLLAQDPETDLILLISKHPDAAVAERVHSALKESGKPNVTCFLGTSGAPDLTEAVLQVAAITGRSGQQLAVPPLPRLRFSPGQRLIRGLYCGGTLCHEAELIVGEGHTFVDFGDDQYTVGRPHPMIDPSLRNDRIRAEAADPETAVILFDLVLGYGSHPDPAGTLAPVIREARGDREIHFIASVCGTDQDPQNCSAQVRQLADAGVLIAPSNAAAARLAAQAVTGR